MDSYDYYHADHDKYRGRYRAGYGPIRKTLCLVGVVAILMMAYVMFSIGWNESVAISYRAFANIFGLAMLPAAWALFRRLWLY